MRAGARLGFRVRDSEINNDIFVPRYYDPSIDARLAELEKTHELVTIGELIDAGELELRQGNYVGKMHYGTGPFPYIRTSDIANWELRGSPKHGVSKHVYAEYATRQEVRPMDVLLVHEGTYLIGTPCLITRYDTKILFQHHLAKLRVLDGGRLTGPLLTATLLAPTVQRQIRSKQFTADVIDSIVGRLPEIALPLPRDPVARAEFSKQASKIFEGRATARVRLAKLMRQMDAVISTANTDELKSPDGEEATGLVSFLGERSSFLAFKQRSADIRGDVLVPRYYDPATDTELKKLGRTCELVTIRQLVEAGRLELETGNEVGKLAYGSGSVPFVRTSDLGNWELKQDPKQLVSEAVYDAFAQRQSARSRDILIVRDGTYLVGSSAIVTEADLPLLYSGGIYRLRVSDSNDLDPYLILALLNARIVKRQMRNKQFTRDVIDTLGRRFEEVVLPIPRDQAVGKKIGRQVAELVEKRVSLREQAKLLGAQLETFEAIEPGSIRPDPSIEEFD